MRGHPRARAQRLDVLIGTLAFFTLMATIQAVVHELRGQRATGAAVVLLVLLVLLGHLGHLGHLGRRVALGPAIRA